MREKQYGGVHKDSWIENVTPYIMHKVQVVNNISWSAVNLCGFRDWLLYESGGRKYQCDVKDTGVMLKNGLRTLGMSV